MTLVLEIEHLTGIAYAAVGPDSDVPDWPPQPDRVFSALVATWAARGGRNEEAAALEWLEGQPAPLILASGAAARTAPASYVPPNDPETGRSGNRGVLPALRSRQPRRFPAARPHDPVVRLLWPAADPDRKTLSALSHLAADTAYVGHSASLTRCHFRTELPGDGASAQPPARRVYPGRLRELCRAFDAGRRPPPGEPVRSSVAEGEVLHRSAFDDRWLLLEQVGGEMPDIRACALVAKAIRDALLDGYGRAGLDDRIPEVISGHAADRSPTRSPHLAVIPLAFAGFPHADGHVLGFALVPPRDSGILDDSDFLHALRKIAVLEDRGDDEPARRILWVSPKRQPVQAQGPGFSVALSPTFERPDRRSLDPALYAAPARTYATVTPMVLDRHLKETGAERDREIAAQIAAACRNIGLPEPEAVVADKHAAVEGAPSARPSGAAPSWQRWRLPPTLASRALTHAVIRFAEPVAGPVILGAGRFVGLGLCRPFPDAETRP